jgi:transposase InsO family protein
MKQYFPKTGLQRLCELFGKTRQGYYDHQRRGNNEGIERAIILQLVFEVRSLLPRIGGVKLHSMLKEKFTEHGISIGRDGFFNLLRSYGLLIKKTKKYVRTTDSNHMFKRWPDLTLGLKISGPGQLWVSDITYLRLTKGFLYLSLVTDAYSRKIIGHHVSNTLKVQGPLIALGKAIASQPLTTNLIHHSDRGIQYCSEPYVSMLQQNGILISMTQSGSPYENAIAERVNGILKIELGADKTFKSYGQAVATITTAISLYNTHRPHMSIDRLTPNEAHKRSGTLKRKWTT